MKIQLETIQYTKSQSSFHFFKREVAIFNSYWHYHPELELTFIERGNGIRYIGDNIGSFESGDLVLIGENLPHDYVSSPSKNQESSIAYVFQFPASIIDSI
ncbi:MAG: AraC family ligand binding domain-containing protein, partial [Bacteroidota bacterium]